MKIFEITYINISGNKKTVDVEAYLEYTAVMKFKQTKKYKKIIGVQLVY